MAEHLAASHHELAEAQKEELARRAWMPAPLGEVVYYGPSAAGGTERR